MRLTPECATRGCKTASVHVQVEVNDDPQERVYRGGDGREIRAIEPAVKVLHLCVGCYDRLSG